MRGHLLKLLAGLTAITFVFILMLISSSEVRAQSQSGVYFSEIGWAGSSVSSADEWLELANASSEDVSIDGWVVSRHNERTMAEEIIVDLSGEIKAGGVYTISSHSEEHQFTKGESVLEQTPDLVAPDLALSNNLLELKLYSTTNIVNDLPEDIAGSKSPDFLKDVIKTSSLARKLPHADGSLINSWYPASVTQGFDVGTTDLGTPGVRNISLPVIENLVCQPQILVKLTDNILSCSGRLVDYSESAVSGNVNYLNQSVQLESNGDGEFVLEKAVNLVEDLVLDFSVENQAKLKSNYQIKIPVLQTSDKIILNEIIPSGEERIELYNSGLEELDLGGWKLDDLIEGGSKAYDLPAGTKILPQSYLVIELTSSGLALNDSGDDVNLIDPFGKIISHTQYSAIKVGSSWSLIEDEFVWTEMITPNLPNRLPDPIVIPSGLQISEFMPNPEGTDSDLEWIELYNSSNQPINLGILSLDDEDGGSKSYKFPNLMLDSLGYFVVYAKDSNLTLNNTNDEVRILNPNGSIYQQIAYQDVIEGYSFARFESEWEWTNKPTPGTANQHKSEYLIQESIVAKNEATPQETQTEVQPDAIETELTEETLTPEYFVKKTYTIAQTPDPLAPLVLGVTQPLKIDTSATIQAPIRRQIESSYLIGALFFGIILFLGTQTIPLCIPSTISNNSTHTLRKSRRR